MQNKLSKDDENTFTSFFSAFVSEIAESNLLEKDQNVLFNSCIKMVREVNKLNRKLILEENGYDSIQVNTPNLTSFEIF